MAYASLPKVNTAIQPLIPALKSNWLIAHVMTCFIGYAAFTIAFGISIMFLVKSSGEAQPTRLGMAGRIPAFDILDDLTHQMVTFGFLFLSIGIITGAVWANQAWGRYWGWDPKETWSLVTWLIYATLLHARLMRGWKGKNIAVLSCVGFVAMLFTYFGVNLLPGLHSYQSIVDGDDFVKSPISALPSLSLSLQRTNFRPRSGRLFARLELGLFTRSPVTDFFEPISKGGGSRPYFPLTSSEAIMYRIDHIS